MSFTQESWFSDVLTGIVSAIVAWATWITVKVFGLDKDKLSETDFEGASDRRHRENVERFERMEKKQDDMLKLLIDVIRKE